LATTEILLKMPPGRARAEGEEVKNTKNSRRWTPEEDNRFRALAEAGRPVAVISERLKRSTKAIYARAIKLGVALKRLGPKHQSTAVSRPEAIRRLVELGLKGKGK
jgi:hypothetical protein